MNQLIIAVLLLGAAVSGCLSSNPAATGGPGGFATDPAGGTSVTERAEIVEDQAKPHQGSVAAPNPDPTEAEKNEARGTMEVLCRTGDPARFSLRLKGQVFKAPESGQPVPCEECAGKTLRVLPDCVPGEECRFEDGKIHESGFFDFTVFLPSPGALALYVMPVLDPYWFSSGGGKSCPGSACVENPVMNLRNLLALDETAVDSAPDCGIMIPAFQKKSFPIFKSFP